LDLLAHFEASRQLAAGMHSKLKDLVPEVFTSSEPRPCTKLHLLSNLHVIFMCIKVNGKVKLSLLLTKHHAMKTYWGSEDIAPRILNLDTSWG